MPAGDGRGPEGLGPMTGRAAGYCAGYSAPGFSNAGRGMGYGRFGGGGRGGGRGRRNRYYETGHPFRARGPQVRPGGGYYGYQQETSPDNEISFLKNQAEFMEKEMSAINERIRELESIATAKKETD